MEKVLFTIAQEKLYNTTDAATQLEQLSKKGFESYYDQSQVDEHVATLRANAGSLSFRWYPHNAPGEWMSQNTISPSRVDIEPTNPARMEEAINAYDPQTIVISTYLSGFSDYRRTAAMIREKYPDKKLIVGSVGALLPEARKLADFALRGDQVSDMRRFLGEEPRPLEPVFVAADTTANFEGQTKSADFGLLISSLGCMYGCDFCPSTAQFGNKYNSPFGVKDIKEAIIRARDTIAPGANHFTLSVAEAQGLGDRGLWKELLRQCADLPFMCDLVTTTSSKILDSYSLEELTSGNMRLTTVNIGVESLIKGYQKNRNMDLKSLIGRLQGAGIQVVSTFIIGLDWHTKENIREEVALLKEIDSNGYIVANLEMQPGTPLFNKYKAEGRLLDVPPELLSFPGYQAFTHPHFSSGFKDMLPLMAEIDAELSEGNHVFAANMQTFLNRKNHQEKRQREEVAAALADFEKNLDPNLTAEERAARLQRFTASMYFKDIFRQVDLFHPFILSTN